MKRFIFGRSVIVLISAATMMMEHRVGEVGALAHSFFCMIRVSMFVRSIVSEMYASLSQRFG